MAIWNKDKEEKFLELEIELEDAKSENYKLIQENYDIKEKLKELELILENTQKKLEDTVIELQNEIIEKDNEIATLDKVIIEDGKKIKELKAKLEDAEENSKLKTGKIDVIKINSFYVRLSNIVAITEVAYGKNQIGFDIFLKDKINESFIIRITEISSSPISYNEIKEKVENLHKKILGLL